MVQLADLAVSTLLFPDDVPIAVIEAAFLRSDSLLTLLVGDVHRPQTIGLVERGPFLTFLAGRLGFGRAIHARKTLAEFDAPSALILDPSTSVADAASLAIARGPLRWADSIVVALRDGFAVVAAATLFKHVTDDLGAQLVVDQLTGALNRRGFLRELAEACRADGGGVERHAVLLLDLDGFKLVNDALGHQAGDQLLASTARRIAHAVPGATIARMGGDEFAVLAALEPWGSPEELGLALIRHLGLPTPIAGTEVIVPGSVGIAVVEPGLEAHELLRRADVALYRAKGAGKNCYSIFDIELNRDVERQLVLSQELRAAISHDRVDLHYQPIVDLDSRQVVAIEALARWTSPTAGAVTPTEFIGLAERTGLIVPLGRSLLRKAMRALATCDGRSTANVHVNISRRELHQPDLVRAIRNLVAETGLDPRRLVIEVTETTVAVDPPRMIATMQELSDLGARIALDDFGAGATAMSNLWQFPLDIVKLDQSLVAPLAGGVAGRHDGWNESRHEARVRAIIDLCHAHDLVVTAEGVEHPEQADLLTRLGCDYAQGWYFGRPAPEIPIAARTGEALVSG